MQCTATYPSKDDELNLRTIPWLEKTLAEHEHKRLLSEGKNPYDLPVVPAAVGYSGHEIGLATSVAAVVMGAQVLERHITLGRSLWGSDQAASIEPHGFARLVRDIRAVESAMGVFGKVLYESEHPARAKLRREPAGVGT
jgi:N-acetylneuraminate synthase